MEKAEGMTKGQPKLIGGLLRRIVMSRFYQKQFAGLVRGFRPTRIEGFFTYNEAVIRRLGGIYDHIDAVGELYKELQQRLIDLNQQVQTAQGVEAQKRGVNIQKFGEAFAWIAVGWLTLNELTKQFLETLHTATDRNRQYTLVGTAIISTVGATRHWWWKRASIITQRRKERRARILKYQHYWGKKTLRNYRKAARKARRWTYSFDTPTLP